MKIGTLIRVIAVLGIFVLLFFPEPQTNFLAYVSTALLLAIVITVLFFMKKKEVPKKVVKKKVVKKKATKKKS